MPISVHLALALFLSLSLTILLPLLFSSLSPSTVSSPSSPLPSPSLQPPPSPHPLILDTDIGDDFDDQAALVYILSSPALFTPQLIIVSTFNTPVRALIVAYTLHLLNRTSIPILIGTQTSNRTCYQQSWVPPSFTLSSYVQAGGVVVTDGVRRLVEFVQHWSPTAAPLRYVEIAPASSLGALLRASPESASKLMVFAMSGCMTVGYGNVSREEVEYNVATDIAASQAMYAAAPAYARLSPRTAGLSVAPLDSTIFVQFTGALWKAFVARNDSAHPAVAALLGAYQHWYDAGGKNNGALLPYSPSTGTSTMFDVQAAFSAGHAVVAEDCAVRVEGFVSQCVQGLVVNDTGYLVVGAGKGGNVSVQVGVLGGRDNPYPAIEAVGRIVLSAIAREPLTEEEEAPVDRIAVSHTQRARHDR